MKTCKSILFLILALYGEILNAQTNLLLNGDFTSGSAAWNFNSQNWWINTFSCTSQGSGGNYAYFGTSTGGYINSATGGVYQDFIIPSNATNVDLTFSISINTYEPNVNIKYDSINIWLTDLSGYILQSLAVFSNLDGDPLPGCQTYQTFTAPIYAGLGQAVRLYIYAQNDGASPTVFRLDDIAVEAIVPTGCVSWYNGTPSDQTVINAAEYLCNSGIIEDVQDGSTSGLISLQLQELTFYLSNSLLGYNASTVTDYYPSPFVDLQSQDPYSNSVKRILDLEYSGGISCLSRDYFYVGTQDQVVFGRAIKAILRAYNIIPNAIDSLGYNSNDNSPSNFICNVLNNDKYYPWIKKAYSLGLLNGVYTSCVTCPASNCFIVGGVTPRLMDKWELFVILANIKQNYPTPPITNNDFFVPNSFTPLNTSSNASTDRGVFNHYEDKSFNIIGGGLPLTFSHKYYSQTTELPYLSQEYYDAKYFFQRVFPLGKGWTHTYNIFIQCIKEDNAPFSNDKKLLIDWADGSTDLYNYATGQYETQGVADVLNVTSNDINNPYNAATLTITKPDGTTFYFRRDFGIVTLFNLEKIVDRNNNVLALTHLYGTNGGVIFSQLAAVVDSFSGRWLSFYYKSGTNYIDSVEDYSGRVIKFNVDTISNNLTSFTDANGNTTNYFYGNNPKEQFLLKQIQRPNGNTITNSYYNRKLQSSQSGNYNLQVDWNQNYLSGGSTYANVTETQSGSTLTTTYQHDSRGNPTSITTPTGSVTMQYTDGNNPDQPTYIYDGNTGITTTIQYETNKRANPVNISKSGGGNTLTELFQYNNFNEVISHTDPNGITITNTYDANGNLTDVLEPNGLATHYNYNSNYLLDEIIDAVGLSTKLHYNTFGNLDSIFIQGTNISSSANYDQLSRITSVKNPNGVLTTFSYDNNDNLTDKYVDPLGLNYQTKNYFDSNDNLVQTKSPRGLDTYLNYDSTDVLVNEFYGSYNRHWEYNQDGTIKTFKNKNNYTFNYDYYPQGDPNAGKIMNDGYAYYTYNGITKNIFSIDKGGKNLVYNFDGLNRLSGISYNDMPANNVQYTYNPNTNQLNFIFTQIPSVGNFYTQYLYDSNGRLKKVRNPNTNYIYVEYFYRPDSKLDHELLGNGTRNNYYYDSASRLDSIVTKNSSGDVIASVSCILDAAGNHASEYLNVLYGGPGYGSSGPLPDTTVTYQYDNMNRLTNIGTTSYTSNANGAVLNNADINTTYTWDEKDNLLSKTDVNGTINYEYDALENRRLKDTTRYVLDLMHDANVLMETNLNGDAFSLYIYGLGLVCRIDPTTNKVYYYHYDFRGSTIAITDSAQDVIQKYEYNAFGKINNADGYATMFKNPFTYVGKYGVMDEGNGLYYMRARYYNSKTGRFLSEDPKWDENLFPYAANNPVTNIDANGESLTSDAWNKGWNDAMFRLKRSFTDPETYNTAFSFALLIAEAPAGIQFGQAIKTVGSGVQYSVAFEMKLASSSYPGVYRGAHFLEANRALSATMATDARVAASMSQLGINIPRSSAGNILGKSPANWVWHHDINAGVMQLVPKSQHTIGSSFWNTLHPGGRGGFSIWGK